MNVVVVVVDGDSELNEMNAILNESWVKMFSRGAKKVDLLPQDESSSFWGAAVKTRFRWWSPASMFELLSSGRVCSWLVDEESESEEEEEEEVEEVQMELEPVDVWLK